MKEWEQYQHQAAELLCDLGFSAEVNKRLTAANGAVHEVDVFACRKLAGVKLRWIVECKRWKRAVPIEKVEALIGRVGNLGADRGLLLSERNFQSGAHRLAKQKNITLTSLKNLRADAADEFLASRVAIAEKSLMDLSLRVNRDLRPFAEQTPQMLATLAARLPLDVVEGFADRPDAVDYVEGIGEVWSQVEGLTPGDHLPFMLHPSEIQMPWRPGIDQNVMDGVAASIHYMTQALYQARVGQWPAMCPAPGAIKLAWSTAQLIGVVESNLPGLEQKVSEQEDKADRTPRLPWYDIVKPGTMPAPACPWGRPLVLRFSCSSQIVQLHHSNDLAPAVASSAI